VTQASLEPAGRQQWAEPRLEAVRKGQVGQTGVTDFWTRSGEIQRTVHKRGKKVHGGPI